MIPPGQTASVTLNLFDISSSPEDHQALLNAIDEALLLQPFITLLLAWTLLGEIISPLAIVTLFLVIGSIIWARSGTAKEKL